MRDDDNAQTGEAPGTGPERGANDTPKLTKIVERLRSINAEVKDLKMEAKEVEDSAWEACGYSAKAVRKLAKEAAYNAVDRERQKQLEEEIERGRVALGFLSDLPLGQAEMQRMEEQKQASINGTGRPRGRPKGSKNKPRGEAHAPAG